MDENYYRDVIDKVNCNEKAMWGGTDEPNDGYEDFNMLWGLLFDEDAKLSPHTYFEAIELCLNSFFGTIQDPILVWRNILTKYENALKNPNEKDCFMIEFKKFLSTGNYTISDVDTFYDLMHLAIDDKDLYMTEKFLDICPIIVECWDLLEEFYKKYPEWAAYFECLTDVSYDKLPSDPIFKETIKRLYSAFGKHPDMNKLANLYHRYE